MRLLDRVAAVFAALVLIGLITVVTIAPATLRSMLAGIEESNLLLRVAVVVVLNILILIALFLGLRGPRKQISGLEVRASGAFTDVSVESARKLILAAVESVPDVISASATVQAVHGRADVDLNVQVMGTDVHVPKKQGEISRALRQVINKQLGLRMRGRPRVHIYLQGEQPVETPALAEPIVLEEKKPVPESVASQPKTESVMPAAADVDDTVLKDGAPKKEERSSLIPSGLFGRHHETEKPADAGEKSGDEWLNSHMDGQNEKDKSGSEQN
ncbi:MAG: hypothetical protein K8J31_08890 [Anaerolineae bacterium]|nr:hypothetical protein [Anaerolineae bacterium]